MYLYTNLRFKQIFQVFVIRARQPAYRFSTLMASIAPKTPTTPSYLPEYGIASI